MSDKVLPSIDHNAFHEQGYIVLRGAFSGERVKALRAGLERLMDDAIAGRCGIDWLNQEKRLPNRIANMLNSDKYQPEFADWLDADLAPIIESLLGKPARHSLFGMLAGGNGQPYLQNWHRDLGKPGTPDEVEFLHRHHGRFVQFNAPIQPGDCFLHIVPQSHLRASTPEEIKASSDGEKGEMPGALVVEMEPGDIAFYNSNLWHRGWNPDGATRWTIHSAYFPQHAPVLQHEYGQRESLLTPGHLERMPPVTRTYIQRYLDAYPEGEPLSLLDL